jgi:hypothetical protein
MPNSLRRQRPSRCRASLLMIIGLSFMTVSSALAGLVSGSVRDAQSLTPLRAMVVAAYRNDGSIQGSATTDASGNYGLSLPSGDYRMLAYDLSGVYATTFAGDADSYETTVPIVVGEPTLTRTFNLRRGGTIRGKIAGDSSALANATVAVYNLSGTRRGFSPTDGGGTYSLVVPPGSYKLVAFDAHGAFAARFYASANTFAAADIITIVAQQTQVADMILERAATISGTVTDASTSIPQPGMNVIAYDLFGVLVANVLTETTGQFQLRVPAGSYKLVVTDATQRYATTFAGDATSFEQTIPLTVSATEIRTVPLKVQPGGIITGHVSAAGVPLPSMTVSAFNLDGTTRTSSTTLPDGSYTLVAPAGDFKFAAYDPATAFATRFYSQSNTFRSATRITSVPGQTINGIDFTLDRAGIVTGLVTDKLTGIGLPEITIAAYDNAGTQLGTAPTNHLGQYRLGLPSGSYRILAFDTALNYATGYIGEASSFETEPLLVIAAPSGASADFRLSHGVQLSGTVADSKGTPVNGVEVSALDGLGNKVSSGVTNAGRFSIVLTPASYRLACTDPQNRYYSSYYENSSTLAGARPVSVGNSPVSGFSFVVFPETRRRAVGH